MQLVNVDANGKYWLEVTGNNTKEAADWYNDRHKIIKREKYPWGGKEFPIRMDCRKHCKTL